MRRGRVNLCRLHVTIGSNLCFTYGGWTYGGWGAALLCVGGIDRFFSSSPFLFLSVPLFCFVVVVGGIFLH